jgi:hypothetical protein
VPAFGDEAHDFTLAIVRSIAKRGFAAHFRATRFQRQRVMKNAELLLFESMRRGALAACNVTGSGHWMAI